MRRIAAFAAALLLLAVSRSGAAAEPYAGHWFLSPGSAAGEVHLRVQYERHEGSSHEIYSSSRDVELTTLPELSRAELDGPPLPKRFTLREDAGTLVCDGTLGKGGGSGTFVFAQSPAFRRMLAERGVIAPSERQAFELTLTRFRIATLDALLGGGFERPTPADLIALRDHGVTAEYARRAAALPLQPKTLKSLATLRDHGVTADYLAGVNRLGYRLTVDEVVRLRDHGVSLAFLERLRARGFARFGADDIVKLYEHGV